MTRNQLFQAASFDHLLPQKWTGTVVSLHQKATNLRSDSGEFLFVVAEPLGDGPSRIVVPGNSVGNLPFRPGQQYFLDHRALDSADGSLTIRLDLAQPWHCSPVPAGACVEANSAPLLQLLPSRPALELARNSAADREFLKRTGVFVKALSSGSSDAIAAATRALMGLGAGLTPSGDDFLRGVLCALTMVPPPHWSAPFTAAVQKARSRTTVLSAAFLGFALEGRFAQHETDLLQAIRTGSSGSVPAAVAVILASGATSGEDFLLGVQDALCVANGHAEFDNDRGWTFTSVP